MSIQLTLTGDVNLMNVQDPHIPFRQISSVLQKSDLVFSNLECCLFTPQADHSVDNEGFYADPDIAGKALSLGHIQGVGLANNVNYGSQAILSSVKELDSLGIGHSGAGANVEQACLPWVTQSSGISMGFLARTSVYWNTHHEARKNTAGVAVVRGHTAYQVPAYKVQTDIPPMNRPGIPPVIVTWADPEYLAQLTQQIKALKTQCDWVAVSCHWGLWEEVLGYMKDIAHAAIQAGADIVFGHGPHVSLPVEIYKGKPIFYGLGSFSFHTGHNGRAHGDWVGMMPQLQLNKQHIERMSFKLVRHNEHNETYFCDPSKESITLERLTKESQDLGCKLEIHGQDISVSAL